jgi:cytosine/creatinine deaminase
MGATMDLILRNATLAEPQRTGTYDIGVERGRIAAIEPKLAARGAAEHDASGRLVVGGMVDSHIHLDKSHILDRCGPEAGRLTNSMPRVSAVKHTFTVEDVYARAKRSLESCILNGAMRMRTHVELDPKVGLRSLEAIEQLARDYAWAIDLEICVFPQEGMTNNPGTEELMIAGLKRGARIVGAAPNYDSDHAAQINRVFAIAREHDADVDMHLDFGNTPQDMDIELVCTLAERQKWGGRVNVGHLTKISTAPPSEQARVAKRMADTGVALTVLTATDLYGMGRDQTHNVRRGVVDVNAFDTLGVACSLGTNNIMNPFTPLGDGDLIRMANLQANTCQIGRPEDLATLFDTVSADAARIMNLKDYGIAVGNPADLVVVDAVSKAEAIAEVRSTLVGWKRGRKTFERTAPVLHRP